jgi:general secretion pathway protein L
MHRIIGLDVGARALRFVALSSGFRGFSVEEARSVALPPSADGAPAGARLTAALEELGLVLGGDTVAVALPGALVASHLFSLPFLDSGRIEQVLPAEVEGAIPFEMDEVVWDHAVISQAGGKSEVLVGVVRKAALREWIETLAAVGIDPRTVTFAPLALAALAERGLLSSEAPAEQPSQVDPATHAASQAVTTPSAAAPGAPGAAALAAAAPSVAPVDAELILAAGPDRADLVLVRAGRPELCRSLSVASGPAWDAAAGDDAARDKLLGTLVRDVKITLRTRVKGGSPLPQPSRLLLAGDVALLPSAVDRFARDLGIATSALSLSAAAVQLPPGSSPPHEVALALGLALRAQQPRGHLNFRKGEFAFTRDFSQVRKHAIQLSIMAGFLLLLAFILGIARVSSLGSQLRDYDEAVCAATRRILGTCTTDYRQALSQLSGGKSKAAGIPRVGAAEVLAEVVGHLPDGAMPLLEDVEVSTTSVRMKGIAESYTHVDQIVSGLKTDKCFGEIKPPRNEKVRDSSKISFAIDFAYTCSGESAGGV